VRSTAIHSHTAVRLPAMSRQMPSRISAPTIDMIRPD